jgi:hypothetical protein
MHLEAHGLYDPIPKANLSKSMDYQSSDDVRMQPGTFFELNYHGGIRAQVVSGDFWRYPQLLFIFPPLRFNTHEMDLHKWRMTIRSKSTHSRVHLSFYNENNFGFRVRIPTGHYLTLQDVFRVAEKSFVVRKDSSNTWHSAQPTIYITPEKNDFVSEMEKDNAKIRERLGDWRPGKPNRENVIDIQSYVERITQEQLPHDDFDFYGKVAELAKQISAKI